MKPEHSTDTSRHHDDNLDDVHTESGDTRRRILQLRMEVRRLENELDQARRENIELRKRTENYKSMLETAEGFAVYQLAVNGQAHRPPEVVFFSPSLVEVLDVDTPLDYRSWFESIHPEDRSRVERGNLLSGKQGIPFDQVFRIRHKKKNSWRWIHAIATPVLDSEGRLDHFNGLVVDVTERKTADEALKSSEKQLRLLIESAPIGIRIAQEGKLVYANPAFVKMYGYDNADEIVGRPIESMVVKSQRQLVLKRQRERLEGKNVSSHYELTAVKKNGDTFQIAVWLTVIEYNKKPAILGFVIDTSLEKKLEAQLFRAQKLEAMGTLAGGIAHDFNNILTAIIGYTELVGLDIDQNSIASSNLEQVIKASNRAKELIRHILAFSRQVEQEKKPVQISPIVKETAKLLRATLPTTIEIKQHIEENLGNVLADPTQIHQVIMNLCTNASYSMRENGGSLTIELKKVELDCDFSDRHLQLDSGTYLRLSITDTGYGIPMEIRERIFEPYFTTKQKGEGTGLGLSVVHGIVKSHGGDVTVYSEPDLGTTFHVYLPVIHQEAASHEIPSGHQLPRGDERVLFVDDEQPLVNLGKQLLSHLGYNVETRTSSVDALELFKNEPERFDLVITDMTMPHITGEQMAKKMMEIRPDLPLILCSGYSEKINELKAKQLGIKAFVMKPLMIRELANVIRTVLDNKGVTCTWKD